MGVGDDNMNLLCRLWHTNELGSNHVTLMKLKISTNLLSTLQRSWKSEFSQIHVDVLQLELLTASLANLTCQMECGQILYVGFISHVHDWLWTQFS